MCKASHQVRLWTVESLTWVQRHYMVTGALIVVKHQATDQSVGHAENNLGLLSHILRFGWPGALGYHLQRFNSAPAHLLTDHGEATSGNRSLCRSRSSNLFSFLKCGLSEKL